MCQNHREPNVEFYDMDLDMIQASSFWGEQHDDIDR